MDTSLGNLKQEILDRKILQPNTLLASLRGSLTYGTYVPHENSSIDDVDIVSIYCGSEEFYYGFDTKDSVESKVEKFDTIQYEVRKAIKLLAECNPNMIIMLWTDPKYFIYNTPAGIALLNNRDLFLSKLAYEKFFHYAASQLKKAEAFQPEWVWIFDKLEEVLVENGVNLQELNVDQKTRNNILRLELLDSGELDRCRKNGYLPVAHYEGDNRFSVGEVLEAYRRIKNRYFAGGRTGAKRKDLIKKYNWDCKNGSHLIRLIKLGIELVKTGNMMVDRTSIDADYLKDIKAGKYKLEEVKQNAEELFVEFEEVKNKSTLPERPDYKEIEKLCIQIIKETL